MSAAGSDLLVGVLQVAMVGEMSRVTEASMELFLMDRDRYGVCVDRTVALGRRRKEIGEAAAARPAGDQELTAAERDESDRLKGEIESLYQEVNGLPFNDIIAHGDELLYGGKHCARAFATFAYALAHMAYNSGGVNFAGLHWCAGSGHRGTSDLYPCASEIAREQEVAT